MFKKSKSIKKFLNKCSSFCVPWSASKKMAKAMGFTKEQMADRKVMNPSIFVQWSEKGMGFGEFAFYNKGGKVYCDNECCDREFIKKMLCKMVDDCVLTEHYRDGTPK